MIDYNKLDKSKTYIAFSSGEALISKIIKWATSSRFSHAFVLFYSTKWNSWLALGEDANGFCLTPAKTENTLAVAELPVNLDLGLQKNVDELGVGYGYATLIGMIWVMIGKQVFKRKWHNPFVSKTKWICSELCTHVAQDSGLKLDLVPADTDPETLYGILKVTPGVVITEA